MGGLINSIANRKLALIVLLLVATDLAILLDIPIIRPVLGFLFLTLVPGLLIFYILKLDKLRLPERLVLSVGLSLSFLLLFGLLLNNLSLSIGYETPLATTSLLISFNITFIGLAIIGCRVNTNPLSPLPNLNLSRSEKVFLIIPILFPALSIFGMNFMNTTNNNIVCMFLLFLIPAYVVFVCFFNQKIPKRLYPVMIFLIGISLSLLMSLRSSHIIGTDAHQEYYFFQTTLNNLHWSILEHSTLNACLSISLLPTIYQSILNINSEYLFKILYSTLFSFCPLVIYITSRKYIGDSYSFLTSFFFMSQYGFKITPLWARVNTAILFFALAIMVLSHDDINKFNKKILFIIFTASTIVSHYSTTYIFFFSLLLAWVGQQILLKVTCSEENSTTISKSHTEARTLTSSVKSAPPAIEITVAGTTTTRYPRFEGYLTITSVALFFTMLFFWYGQLTEIPFKSGVSFVHKTFTNLHNFFILESRSRTVEQAFGWGLQSVPQQIEFVLSWLTILLIVIGFLITIRKLRDIIFIHSLKHKKSDFSLDKFDAEYFTLVIACFAILVFSVIAPQISVGYGMERTYFQMMVPLSIFFVLGGITASEYLKLRPHWLLLIVLIPYFMCTTGTMYQIFDVPRDITLNSEGNQYNLWYIHDQESYGAKWLGNQLGQKEIRIFTDSAGNRRLMSQGGISIYAINRHALLEQDKEIEGCIYLRYYNVVDGKLLDMQNEKHNITEYNDKFAGKSKLYSNGGAEIWK